MKQLLERIQAFDIPFLDRYWKIFVWFLAIFCLRTIFESVASGDGVTFKIIIHYALFYFVTISQLMLLMLYLTKIPFQRLMRIFFGGFAVVLIAPVIDFVIGLPFRYTYIDVASLKEIIRAFILFFGDISRNGVTLGLHIELALIIFLISVLIYSDSRSYKKSLIGLVAAYLILFANSIAPLFGKLANLGLNQNWQQLTMIRWWMVLFAITWLLIATILKSREVAVLIKDLRWERITHYVLFAVIGAGIAAHRQIITPVADLVLVVILAVISFIFAVLFCIINNNINDQRIDAISNPGRPLVSGAFTLAQYRRIGWLALAISLLIIFPANREAILAIVLFISLYTFYSSRPFRFKRIFILSKFVIAANSLIMLELGYFFFTRSVFVPSIEIVIGLLVCLTLASQFIDLKDAEGDRADHIFTLPIAIGMRNALIVCFSMFFVGHLALPFILNNAILLIPAACWIGFFAWAFFKQPYREGRVFLIHNLSLVYIAGYLFFNKP